MLHPTLKWEQGKSKKTTTNSMGSKHLKDKAIHHVSKWSEVRIKRTIGVGSIPIFVTRHLIYFRIRLREGKGRYHFYANSSSIGESA